MIVLLYKGLVRPILEYAAPVWNPYMVKDITALEGVQRRATKMIPGLSELSYGDRLRRINLPTLTYRRLRGDVITTWKYLHGVFTTQGENMFQRAEYGNTRGHNMKLFQKRSRLQIRQKFFSNRMVQIWNSLPIEVTEAESINRLKNSLDNHWKNAPFRFDYLATPSSMHATQYT